MLDRRRFLLGAGGLVTAAATVLCAASASEVDLTASRLGILSPTRIESVLQRD